jgi:peptidoglycan hydrolase-like protein with peptidoglycan-binding domain
MEETRRHTNNSASTFDLLSQPFYLLGVSPAAKIEELSEALEDRLSEGQASQSDLLSARQIAANPKKRLKAELASLLDTPEGAANEVIQRLRQKTRSEALKFDADRLSPLSRANLYAHIASSYPADATMLRGLVQAHAAIDDETLIEKIRQTRKSAGFPSPSPEGVNEALHELFDAHYKAAFEGYSNVDDAVAPMNRAYKTLADDSHTQTREALEGLLRSYGQFISSDLSAHETEIRRCCQKLASDEDLADEIVKRLAKWKTLFEPILRMESQKGRDEPRAASLCSSLRDACIELANEHDEYGTALKLTDAALTAFAELPQSKDQLQKDRLRLEDLQREKSQLELIKPLINAIEEAEKDPKGLIKILTKKGFSGKAGGQSSKIYNAFAAAVDASAGTDSRNLPWYAVRRLALALNNDHDAHKATLSVLLALSKVAARTVVSDEVRDFIREDTRQVERNLLQAELIECAKSGNRSRSLVIIQDLLSDCSDQQEREMLLSFSQRVKDEQRSTKLKWAFWAFIAFVGYLVIANDNQKHTYSPSPRYNSPSGRYDDSGRNSTYGDNSGSGNYNSQTSSSPSQEEGSGPYTETKPAIGTATTFNRANIRYCVFQEARLDALKPFLQDNEAIDRSNELVRDWNSRCGRYTYRERDMSAVQSELPQRIDSLKAQAREILSSWRKPATGNVSTAPYAAPITEPLQLPPQLQNDVPANTASLDLLNLDDATRVQSRLHDLGYLKAKANGVWGQNSRRALLAFKIKNNLPSDDTFTPETATALFSSSAIPGTPDSLPGWAAHRPETPYAAPAGASLNPLNRTDAEKINGKLRMLGYFSGKNDGLWSGASRDALKRFKAVNQMNADDIWDANIEQRLLSAEASPPLDTAQPPSPEETEALQRAFDTSIGGIWSVETAACPGGKGGSNALPVRINSNSAKSRSGSCTFTELKGSQLDWDARATCSAGGQSWESNIHFERRQNTLRWSSEKGTTIYELCP